MITNKYKQGTFLRGNKTQIVFYDKNDEERIK